MATLVHVAPDAESKVEAVRAAATGASAWDGMLVARLLAENNASLRKSVAEVLDVLRGGRALPRVWMC
jgi:urease accessory protein